MNKNKLIIYILGIIFPFVYMISRMLWFWIIHQNPFFDLAGSIFIGVIVFVVYFISVYKYFKHH